MTYIPIKLYNLIIIKTASSELTPGRKLSVFNSVTVDGFFCGLDGDMSWAHRDEDDPEWKAFVLGNAKGSGILAFGRITYELMARFWPSAQARHMMPTVAERMNTLAKIVFSRTMGEAHWNNTTLVKGGLTEAMRQLKAEPGEDITILGSGTLVSQLAQEALVDEYHMVVIPIALGEGRSLFEGMGSRLTLKLRSTRVFGNGNVLLSYGS